MEFVTYFRITGYELCDRPGRRPYYREVYAWARHAPDPLRAGRWMCGGRVKGKVSGVESNVEPCRHCMSAITRRKG